MISLGPGGPRYSENLLDAIVKNEINELNAQDFVYVKIANDTIKRSVIINTTLALMFIIVAPWGGMLPSLLAQGIAVFTVNIIWEPALALLNFNIALSIVYIAGVIGFMSFVCLKSVQRFNSPEEEAPKVQY